MRYFFLLFFLFAHGFSAQIISRNDSNRVKPGFDSLVIDAGAQDSLSIFKPDIYDYRYYTQFSEKKIFDTAFTPDKTFIFSQYNNRDNFGRIQFANIGSGFQSLSLEIHPEKDLSLLPTNKSFFILGINDVKYYDVKTPTTSFIYHNAMRNGAALQSTYTQNIGKNFNFALEYMGLRSQGFYQNSLAANNNLVFSSHFISKNSKYEAFGHFVHQNVNNEEYGGIEDISLFTGDNNNFDNRENLQVNLINTDSRYSYRRFYFSHQFRPFSSERFPFKVRHTIFRQSNKYFYNQSAPENYYLDMSDLITEYPLSSKKFSTNLSNTLSVLFDSERFKLDAGVRHQSIKYGLGTALPADMNIPSELKENRIGAVANLGIDLFNKVELSSNFEFSTGSEFGNYLRSQNLLKFEPIENYFVKAKVNFKSASPTFNLLLNNSVYQNFNYFLSDPKNEVVTEIGGDINLNWFKSKIFAEYIRIDNYTFINSAFQPEQSSSSLSVSKVGGDATFSFGKFHLNSRLMFQSALSGKEYFPMPSFIGRANVYWQSKVFRDAAEIQTGIKAYYFSRFNSRQYFPVLNEFVLPGAEAHPIGGQPVLDAYFNMKVKRMFFFIEGQHFNTTFMKNRSYTAPLYPFHDFRLNIGIVWYLFH